MGLKTLFDNNFFQFQKKQINKHHTNFGELSVQHILYTQNY